MSRIFDALQRADLERRTGQVPEVEPFDDSAVVPDSVEPSPVQADVALEDVAQYSWKPSFASILSPADSSEKIEQFRRLRSRLSQARHEAPLKTVLISSGLPSEGKSFVAVNLAMTLARDSVNQVLLIDGDMRRPTLHSLLGAPSTPGLSEYLSGTAELKDILQRDSGPRKGEAAKLGDVPNLIFIPSGKCGESSSELVANHRMQELIETVSPHFDWILIDTPPVLAVTDAVDLASAADAVLLVARAAKTPYQAAQRALAMYKDTRILGVVLNAVKNVPHKDYYYSSYYSGQNNNSKTHQDKSMRRQH